MALVIFPFGFVTLAISSSAFSIFQIQIYPHFSVPVNGNWGAWRPWSTCTKTCGGGVKRRTRTCSNPAPKNGGRACTGSSAESQACNTSPCKGKRLQLLSSFFFFVFVVVDVVLAGIGVVFIFSAVAMTFG